MRPGKGGAKSFDTRLYGAHAVLAALANPARKIKSLKLTRNALARCDMVLAGLKIKPELASGEEISALIGGDAVHQGFLLDALPLEEPALEDIRLEGILLVLDQVSDPHNVGAILRSAAAFGATALIMTARNSPPQTGVLAKSASGGLEHVPIVRVTNLARALRAMADGGAGVVGLDGDGDATLSALGGEAGLSPPLALVLGAEGKGLRRLTREMCDRLARIDTSGPLASLNVSNAAAVALYELAGKGVKKPV